MKFVILCGGSGSRLWPKSREKLPKQFLKLTNNYTMLQNTIFRIKNIIDNINDNINNKNNQLIIICNKDHSFIVEKQIEEITNQLNNLDFTIITEPKGRDSGPAICIASLLGNENDNTFIMPCDHIFNDEEFTKCSLKAFQYLDNSIITFGIKPNKPEIAYGYIKIGENNETEEFVEKPNLELAKIYIESNNYSWNAGIFIFKNRNMLQCFSKYAPNIYQNCRETIVNSGNLNAKLINLNAEPFSTCEAISVDYAIMENLTKDKDENKNIKALTILYSSHWNDIGSYTALYNEMIKDDNNNVLIGNTFNLNTKNSYIETEDIFTSVIGLDNIIVVNTRDSLLICNNDCTQDVKKVVEHLKKNGKEEALFHKKVFRPWGYYVNVEGENNSGFKMKRISVYPGKRLSLQSHNHRSEHWVIVKGTAKVQVGENFYTMKEDEYVYIPIKELHRIENTGNDLMEFTETQIGSYLGEDDIIRYEDDWGRNL